MEKIKKFFVENGFISLVALFVTVFSFLFGFGFIGTIALGFFVGRNWEIIKKLWKESQLKDKVDDLVDEVKEKF